MIIRCHTLDTFFACLSGLRDLSMGGAGRPRCGGFRAAGLMPAGRRAGVVDAAAQARAALRWSMPPLLANMMGRARL